MNDSPYRETLEIGCKLKDDVLEPMKRAFVGKDEVIDLLGVSLVARENLFILGPPGTAKSALVQDLAQRIEGQVFDYLLTRFTEPNEIFGPFDIRKLREGDLVTNTEGMLPEATFVFLDELLNANSAILNSLLLVLNERVFRRGRETKPLPHLDGSRRQQPIARGRRPRGAVRPVSSTSSMRQRQHGRTVQCARRKLAARFRPEDNGATVSVEGVRALHGLLRYVDVAAVRSDYVELIHRLRHAGISVSDRRAAKLQRLMGASALLCGRLEVNRTDMWVLRYIWDTEEQQDVLATIVKDALEKANEEEKSASHPRSRGDDAPDPEHLARDLERIADRFESEDLPASERTYLRDQLNLLASRCQWVEDPQQRTHLESEANSLLERIGGISP